MRTPLPLLKTRAELVLREIVRSIANTTDSAAHLANRPLARPADSNGLQVQIVFPAIAGIAQAD